ncbi:MAG: hypothetical protein QOG77_4062 [Solirubrobacteraceae bacterium]|nr:hypothetical protein [Solirubrobacteraceae bacterium]
MRQKMRLCAGPAALAAILWAGLLPAPAGAAAVELNRACYLEGARVGVSATGFAPRSTVTVRRDGTTIGTANADDVGAVQARFDAPQLPEGRREASPVLELSDGTTSAFARLPITRFHASFAPSTGDPATMLVRFDVDGFGLLDAQPDVYVHYVGPSGVLRETVNLGRSRGVCGHLRTTSLRRLFPFRARAGTWTLQFDTRKTYRRGRIDRPGFLFFTRRVKVVEN